MKLKMNSTILSNVSGVKNNKSIDDIETTPFITKRSKSASPESTGKLGTYNGVVVPVMLGMMGVIMFLRLGWVIGNAGYLSSVGMLFLGTCVVSLSASSLSAISSNGEMGAGGAYYVISRALGPSLGGSLGILLYVANVFAGVLYLLGVSEVLYSTFSASLPSSSEIQLAFAFLTLAITLIICIIGASFYANTSMGIFTILIISTISVFISFLFLPENPIIGYLGFSFNLLKDNLWSRYSIGSDGTQATFASVFGVFFPSMTGIMAGANMSGDLKTPSRSISRGTFMGIGIVGVVYFLLIFVLAGSVEQGRLIAELDIVSKNSLWSPLIVSGELAAIFSSVLGSVIGASRILQAVSRDKIFPFLNGVGIGSGPNDEPRVAVIITCGLMGITLLIVSSVDVVARFVSTFFLVAYALINFACLALQITGTANYRPIFKWSNLTSSLLGTISCIIVMFLIEPLTSVISVGFYFIMSKYVDYLEPEIEWGEISQAVLFHQVRKYLLVLDSRKDHIKYWRPQILFFVSNPRSQHSLVGFLNNLKKGGMLMCGHVEVLPSKVADDSTILEVVSQRDLYLEYAETTSYKLFSDVVSSESVVMGAHSLLLSAGLGAFRPNTIVLGFYEESKPKEVELDESQNEISEVLKKFPPLRDGKNILSPKDWVDIQRESRLLGNHIMIARGFENLQREKIVNYAHKDKFAPFKDYDKMTIDLWLLEGASSGKGLYDPTISLNLLMGHIVSRTDIWKKSASIRVISVVEKEEDVLAESIKCSELVENARINASVEVIPVIQSLAFEAKLGEKIAKTQDPSISIWYSLPSSEKNPILNELIKGKSQTTAVCFLTSPELPRDRSKEACVQFINDMDVLTIGLPPTLLIRGHHAMITTEL